MNNLPTKWFIEPTEETVDEICKWFDKNHGYKNYNTFYQESRSKTLCYTNSFNKGNVVFDKKSLQNYNIPEITIDQFRKITNPKKEIIGYRLIKPEYAKAACQIINYQQFGEVIKNGQCIDIIDSLGIDRTSAFKKLEDAGVLNLWFEPVYEQDFKVGDIVVGWHNSSCSEITPWKIADIRGEFAYTGYGSNTGLIDIRHATPEEIEEYNRPKLPEINGYSGKIENDYVVYGCAIIPIYYFVEHNIVSTRFIKSLVLSSGVEINEEQMNQIRKVINHNKS